MRASAEGCETVHRILSYVNKEKRYFIPAMGALLLGIFLDMFNPYFLKLIIDRVIIAGESALLTKALAGFLAVTFGRVILGYLKEYGFDYGGQKVAVHLQADLFAHLQGLSFDFFDRTNTGELMSRLKDDVDQIRAAFTYVIMLSVENVIYFVSTTAILFALNWKLSLVALLLMPFIARIALRLEKEVGEICERISDQGAKINTTAQENIAGVRVVKAFGREQYEYRKFLQQNQENYGYKLKRARIWGRYFPQIEFLTNLSVILVTVVGGALVIGDDLSVGTLVAFSNYVTMLIWPMRMSGWLMNDLAEGLASVTKINQLFAAVPTVQEPAVPTILHDFKGHLVFDHVSYLRDGQVILEDISFEAPPGSTIAIMGVTGAGKTSLVNLIGRYYDYTSGAIYLDGVEIRKLPLQLLRRQVAMVMQDTFLFSATIEENIRFGGDDTLTREELEEALEQAALAEFIAELPQGLATVIGERGIGLSGGQKQRLALARALVKKSPILILDDATSNLDLETEYRIQQALEMLRGRTKIIIAHRISAVKNADEILILEQGRIVERGTHQQLLAFGKRYATIYRDQFQGIKTPEVKPYAY